MGERFPNYPHRALPPRGHPPQRLVEVRVGGPEGYAYLEADAHETILETARSAIGYRRAVIRAALMLNSHPIGWGQGDA